VYDPIQLSGTPLWEYGITIFDSAQWFETDGTRIGGVATSWEIGDDGLAWNFHIRDGMKFHDGSPVTVQDVQFNFEREGHPKARSRLARFWRKQGHRDPVTIHGSTVRVNLEMPYPSLPIAVLQLIYPKAGFGPAPELSGAEFQKAPIGSGPWKFVDQKEGVSIDQEWSGREHAFRQTPDFAALSFLAIPEETTRIALLKTGGADWISISPQGASDNENAGFRTLTLNGIKQVVFRMHGLGNPEGMLTLPHLNNIRVREALDIAINREEILSELLLGRGVLSARDHVANTGVMGFDPNWEMVKYDPERAKKILAEEGYPGGGFEVRIAQFALPGASWTSLVSAAIAGYWSEIGVKATLVPVEYSTWRQLYREHPTVKILGQYGWSWTNNSSYNYGSSNFSWCGSCPSGMHLLGVDKEVDGWLHRQNTSSDPAVQAEMANLVAEKAWSYRLGSPIADTPILYSVSDRVGTWDPIRQGGPAYSYETVTRTF